MLAAARTHKRAGRDRAAGCSASKRPGASSKRGMSVALVHLIADADGAASSTPPPDNCCNAISTGAASLSHRRADREKSFGVERPRPSNLPTALHFPPISWSSPSASAPTSILARRGTGRQSRHRRSSTTCAPAILTFSPSGVVEHRGQVFGLGAPLWIQAKVCARGRLAGDGTAAFAGQGRFPTSLKIPASMSFGRRAGWPPTRMTTRSPCAMTRGALYKKIVMRDGKNSSAQCFRRGGRWAMVSATHAATRRM